MSDVNWAEKRNALRQRTFKRGRIIVNNITTMDCVIRNMSLTGARIALPSTVSLPDEFELLIGDEGLRRKCELMSRGETSAGLRFLQALSPRELGAEFMSAKRSSDKVAETKGDRANVSPPALETAEPSPATASPVSSGELQEPGISRIKHRTLPKKVRRNLPW